jgi:hypothetical protein
MKSKIIWLGIVIILWTGSYPFSLAQEYNIRVTPRNYNFGKVKLGEESSKSIDISSIQGNYVIASYTFTPNSSSDFRITSTPFSDTISQGQAAYIEITFKPTSPGLEIATLSVSFRQGMDVVFHIPVNFKGIGEGSTPRDIIAGIQTFVDTAIKEGTLTGLDEGALAQRHLKDFKEQIRIAVMFLKNNIKKEACRLFLDAIQRMDGESTPENPPDLVQGEATPELTKMLSDLRKALNCD